MEPDAVRAARFLAEGHARLAPFEPVPQIFAPRTIQQAFAAQDALQAIMTDTLGPVAGWKIALTTRVMQQMVGWHEPVPGAVFARTVHRSPAQVHAERFTHLGIECELAVRLGADLPAHGAPYDRDAVAAAVAAVMPAFELVDDRRVDYSRFAANILSFVADNAWNAGVVLGAPVTDWHTLDLASLHGVLSVNGEPEGEGHGRDVMGHPLDALTWLANALAARGRGLAAGMLIMTGSIVATRFVAAGDEAAFRLGALGEVHASIC
jgi:2-keto-4-pentenoate hydratase